MSKDYIIFEDLDEELVDDLSNCIPVISNCKLTIVFRDDFESVFDQETKDMFLVFEVE